MLTRFINWYCAILDKLIALALAVMVVLVFGNVVLRYAMNSGITLSEELSRWLFVWLTFLGAIVALKEHGHLGTDMLVGRLGPTGKRICYVLSHVLMFMVCVMLLKGSYDQAVINWTSTSAVMNVPLSWVYFPGMIFAVLGGLIVLTELIRLLTGQVRDRDLVTIAESEDTAHVSTAPAKTEGDRT